jgi:hypothetical protein
LCRTSSRRTGSKFDPIAIVLPEAEDRAVEAAVLLARLGPRAAAAALLMEHGDQAQVPVVLLQMGVRMVAVAHRIALQPVHLVAVVHYKAALAVHPGRLKAAEICGTLR